MPLNLGSQRKNWQNTEGFQDIEATLHDSIMLLLFNQSAVSDSVTPWTAACQASQSFSVSQRLLHLMSIESMMTFNHLTLFPPLLFLSSIFPSIRDLTISYHLCASDDQNTGASASASVLPVNIQC